jgi:hypothetical protein
VDVVNVHGVDETMMIQVSIFAAAMQTKQQDCLPACYHCPKMQFYSHAICFAAMTTATTTQLVPHSNFSAKKVK